MPCVADGSKCAPHPQFAAEALRLIQPAAGREVRPGVLKQLAVDPAGNTGRPPCCVDPATAADARLECPMPEVLLREAALIDWGLHHQFRLVNDADPALLTAHAKLIVHMSEMGLRKQAHGVEQ
mmetsp:Transcript_100329/g.279364  ORF Transcript_100329/g.279364 Transcript_100329/m.279364 type:complete len:124 (-) Transcript_100329:85-456(-)